MPKKNAALVVCVLTGLCHWHGARAQSAGDTVVTVGGAWLNLANSSSTPFESRSAFGDFTSVGTKAEVHDGLTAELLATHLFTDNIAFEAAMGAPPTLNAYAQGTIAPLGENGPQLPLGNLQPLASTHAWPATALIKYYFRVARSRVRPFLGLGLNYTWYSNIHLNPAFSQAAEAFAGPGGAVKASLSSSWNPVVTAGLSYEFSDRWYATASLTYFPLRTTATIQSVAANGATTLANKTRITIDPITVFAGIGYRF
ncbi:OmpW family protein [Paraburkholderia aspalathi]|nr:OmpW family protein [Paraburkholderia aspalathi]